MQMWSASLVDAELAEAWSLNTRASLQSRAFLAKLLKMLSATLSPQMH